MRERYRRKWAGAKRKNVREHILIAERVLGRRLPRGAQVHHFDENERNNAHSNLVICPSMAYHKLLHYRAKILRLGGDPDTQKHCPDCDRLLPFGAFNRRSDHGSSGLQTVCRQCAHARYKAWMPRRGAA